MSSNRSSNEYLDEFKYQTKRIKEKMQNLENELKQKSYSQSELAYPSSPPQTMAAPYSNTWNSRTVPGSGPLVDMYSDSPTLTADLHARLGLPQHRVPLHPQHQQHEHHYPDMKPENTPRNPLSRYHNNLLNQRGKMADSSELYYLTDSLQFSTPTQPPLHRPVPTSATSSPALVGGEGWHNSLGTTTDPILSGLFPAPTTRQVSALLSALEKSKLDNETLAEKLYATEGELKRLKVYTEDMKTEFEAKISEKVSETIAEVYQAQRSRDEAMMERLRAASRMSAEPQHAMEYHSRNGLDEDHFRENHELQRAVQEKEESLRKVASLEDELQNLRIYYSLHKSLSPSGPAANSGHSVKKATVPENANLLEQLKTALAEKAKLADEVIQLQNRLKDEEMKNEKLNRIVVVLRKKLGQMEHHV